MGGVLVLVLMTAALAVNPTRYVYGKYYFAKQNGEASYEDNAYYLFTPPDFNGASGEKRPMMVEYHGGGFTGGSATSQMSAKVQGYLDNGFFFASVNYRLVATKYFYKGPQGHKLEEEFLHINSTGHIWPDSSGKMMSDYKVRIGRQEFNTKCSYDAAQGFEHLLSLANSLGIDVHSIAFTGSSAGGGEMNYLTYVYHSFFTPPKYSPRSMVYTMAQLDYPVQNMLDRVWSLWGDDAGRSTKLSAILADSEANCDMIIGNPWCESNPSGEVNLCNKTWDQLQRQKFCGPNFGSTTVGDLVEGTQWDTDTEHNKGLAILWYNSLNMQKHSPTPFYLYVENQLNSTEGMNLVHNAMHARNYAKFAGLSDINYTVYYTDYHAMTTADRGTKRFEVPGRGGDLVYNFRSSIPGYLSLPGIAATRRTSAQEQLQFVCHAHGVDCSAPAPAPAPDGPLSPKCQAAVKTVCGHCDGTENCCGDCVRQNAHPFVQKDGCPPADQNGFHRVMAFCTSLL